MQANDDGQKERPVYEEEKVLDLTEIVRSVDSYDNVAVFFNDSGKCVPYEHEYKRTVPGQRPTKVIILSLVNVSFLFLQTRFEQSIANEKDKRLKIGKEGSDVNQVKYLPRAH